MEAAQELIRVALDAMFHAMEDSEDRSDSDGIHCVMTSDFVAMDDALNALANAGIYEHGVTDLSFARAFLAQAALLREAEARTAALLGAGVSEEFKRGFRAAIWVAAEHAHANLLACELKGLTDEARALKTMEEFCLLKTKHEPNWEAVQKYIQEMDEVLGND